MKHALFSNLYSLVGADPRVRPQMLQQSGTVAHMGATLLEFLDQEICTESFALQMGIAVAAGIPAGFAGRAAGQGLIAFVGNNALGRVAAFLPRIFATHYLNSRLSGEIQARLNHQAYHWADVSLNDVLPMMNLGAGEVFGHATQGLAGGGIMGFIAGRMIGGATNCLGSGFEIFAGQQINKLSRHVLHRNLFEEVEQRNVSRDAMNVKEWIRNSVMDGAFCAGHGLIGVGGGILPPAIANRFEGGRTPAPTIESPRPQDFLQFARQTPEILRQTALHTTMLSMGVIGGGGRGGERLTQELRGLREHLDHAEKHLQDMQRIKLSQDAEAAQVVVEDLNRRITVLEEEMRIQPIKESHPVCELMGFVPIRGGKFRMGGEDADAYDNEGPVQEITLPDFSMTETVVTNAAFEHYREAMQEKPYAVIATEESNPYCWIIGRFATRAEAESYAGEGREENVQELLESTSAGNDQGATDFFQARKFKSGLFNVKTNPNGVQIVEALPNSYKRGENFGRAKQPAAEITWYEALGCADWLGRSLNGLPGRLPTAAESEFVRRGGIDPKSGQCRNAKYGTSDGEVPNEANADFNRSYDEGPKDVDGVPENFLGLRINGVWEWCSGWYRSSLEGLSETSAGFLEPEYNSRELRGVSWGFDNARYARAANRNYNFPDDRIYNIGFRCVVVAPQD